MVEVTLTLNSSKSIIVTLTYKGSSDSTEFSCIDSACDFIVDDLDVVDEDVDEALTYMSIYDHNTALFKNGKFISSTRA